MKKRFSIPSFRTAFPFLFVCFFGCVLGCRPVSGTTPQSSGDETLCIHLYNLAGAPPRTVKAAMAQADTIFGRVGVRVAWEEPPAASPEIHFVDLNSDGTAARRAAVRPCLVVKIGPNPPSGAYSGALGFAVPFARSGIDAELFYRRIETEARSAGLAVYVVLAHALAHEIGHVLLRSSAHSSAGIMKARWDRDNWRLATWGIATFLPQQANQMRHEVARLAKPGSLGPAQTFEQEIPTASSPFIVPIRLTASQGQNHAQSINNSRSRSR